MRLPTEVRVDATLARLGVAEQDRQEMLAAGPPSQDADLAALFERCHHELVDGIGGLGSLGKGWTALPDTYGSLGRYFYVWVLISAIPALRNFHAERGISEQDTFAILSELAAQLENGRALTGEGGLRAFEWMTVHFRGAMYRTGRLLFERQHIWFDAGPESRVSYDTSPKRGDWSLGIHIPRGRLTPEECDASIAAAEEFYRKHFPDEPYAFATCVSWVLDEKLVRYLSADSNIVRFQRRFQVEPITPSQDDDSETVAAVFRRRWSEVEAIDELPRNTTLERAIIDELRSGGHWFYRTGWFVWRTK